MTYGLRNHEVQKKPLLNLVKIDDGFTVDDHHRPSYQQGAPVEKIFIRGRSYLAPGIILI